MLRVRTENKKFNLCEAYKKSVFAQMYYRISLGKELDRRQASCKFAQEEAANMIDSHTCGLVFKQINDRQNKLNK